MVCFLFLFLSSDLLNQMNSELYSQAYCDVVKIGMSRQEVEKILGTPGDYRTKSVIFLTDSSFVTSKASRWCGNCGLILVGFDRQNKVNWKTYIADISMAADNTPPSAHSVGKK